MHQSLLGSWETFELVISEGDQFLLYMRNLPNKVHEFLQLHQNATTVSQIKLGVQDYYIRTRVQGDLGTVHVAQPVQKTADLKDKTCFNCGKKGHLAENCPEPKKCIHCGKKGHVAKDCWEKHPDKKPKPKPKSQSSNSKGKSGNDKKGQTCGRGKGIRAVAEETSFEPLMVRKSMKKVKMRVNLRVMRVKAQSLKVKIQVVRSTISIR